MPDFKIFSDSCCDLTRSMAAELELEILPMTVVNSGREVLYHLESEELPIDRFYSGLRAGAMATTTAINPAEWIGAVRPVLKEGMDALILVFSSGLSTTYNNARIAAEELCREFPDRRVLVVDSLCASRGEGLFCYHVAKKRLSGASLEETQRYAEETKLHLCHWFTVDDLMFLKRGGRVSGTAAAVGTLLNIKPVLHVDDEGHLIPVSKVRGRRASLNAMVAEMMKTAIDPQSQTIFIGHGDCLEDAEYVRDQVAERVGAKEFFIHPIGPIIGAHSGPGTVALFFLGTKR